MGTAAIGRPVFTTEAQSNRENRSLKGTASAVPFFLRPNWEDEQQFYGAAKMKHS